MAPAAPVEPHLAGAVGRDRPGHRASDQRRVREHAFGHVRRAFPALAPERLAAPRDHTRDLQHTGADDHHRAAAVARAGLCQDRRRVLCAEVQLRVQERRRIQAGAVDRALRGLQRPRGGLALRVDHARADGDRRLAKGGRGARHRQRRDAGHRALEDHDRDVVHRARVAVDVGLHGRGDEPVAPGEVDRLDRAGVAADAGLELARVGALDAVRGGEHAVGSDQRAAAERPALLERREPGGVDGRNAVEDRGGGEDGSGEHGATLRIRYATINGVASLTRR